MTITQKDIEAILGEGVPKDIEPSKGRIALTDKEWHHNMTLKMIRSSIPETARKIMEMVKEIEMQVSFRNPLYIQYPVLFDKKYYVALPSNAKNVTVVRGDNFYEFTLPDELATLSGEDEGDNGK